MMYDAIQTFEQLYPDIKKHSTLNSVDELQYERMFKTT